MSSHHISHPFQHFFLKRIKNSMDISIKASCHVILMHSGRHGCNNNDILELTWFYNVLNFFFCCGFIQTTTWNKYSFLLWNFCRLKRKRIKKMNTLIWLMQVTYQIVPVHALRVGKGTFFSTLLFMYMWDCALMVDWFNIWTDSKKHRQLR